MGATSSSSTPRDGGRSGGGVHDTYPSVSRVHRASHPSCTTPTTPKQTNVTLHPAADGSTRITSPRILTSASAFAGTSPPRRRRSALVGSPSRTTSCALSLFQSLMVSSIDKVGSRVTALATIQSDDNVHVIDVIDSKKLPPPRTVVARHTLSSHPSHLSSERTPIRSDAHDVHASPRVHRVRLDSRSRPAPALPR